MVITTLAGANGKNGAVGCTLVNWKMYCVIPSTKGTSTTELVALDAKQKSFAAVGEPSGTGMEGMGGVMMVSGLLFGPVSPHQGPVIPHEITRTLTE